MLGVVPAPKPWIRELKDRLPRPSHKVGTLAEECLDSQKHAELELWVIFSGMPPERNVKNRGAESACGPLIFLSFFIFRGRKGGAAGYPRRGRYGSS